MAPDFYAPDPIATARAQLLHLRAEILRVANEVEASCDCVSGKRASRARATMSGLAGRLRKLAMSPEAVRVSK